MNKKFLSMLVIFCTIISVTFMIIGSKIKHKQSSEQPKEQVVKLIEKKLVENDTKKENKVQVVVFKPTIKEDVEILTLPEKEKLLLVSRKLSALDYCKIKGYIEGDKEDIEKVFKLLQCRLTENEYSRVKEIANKDI